MNQYACFLFFVFHFLYMAYNEFPVCLYYLIPQNCSVFLFIHWCVCVCVCVCTICLSFRCLGLCILGSVNVYRLYFVVLHTHCLSEWGTLRLCGQQFLHVVNITGIYCQFRTSEFYFRNCLYSVLDLALPLLYFLFLPWWLHICLVTVCSSVLRHLAVCYTADWTMCCRVLTFCNSGTSLLSLYFSNIVIYTV